MFDRTSMVMTRLVTLRMIRWYHPLMIAFLASFVVAGGCGSENETTFEAPIGDSSIPSEATVKVVTTTNIVADWVENVGGDRVEVLSMLSVGADPHGFVPRPTDVTALTNADLIFTIGLGLESGWFEELLQNTAADKSNVVTLGEVVSPIASIVGDDNGPVDPHFWFDPLRVKSAVNDIAARLSVLDQGGRTIYADNARKYNQELDALHAWVQQRVSMIPSERRLLVTSHDSLQYFATAYGFEVVGTVFPRSAPDVEPSAADLGNLVKAIDEYGVAAIFGETTVTERLAAAIANETGAKVVKLFSGSLGGPDSRADSYIAMTRTNVERIVGALE